MSNSDNDVFPDKIFTSMASISVCSNFVFLFYKIKQHNDSVGEQLRISDMTEVEEISGNVIVVPVAGLQALLEL